MEKILLPRIAAIFILITCMAFMSAPHANLGANECKPTDLILELSKPTERIKLVIPDQGHEEVILCNLEIGETYDLYLSAFDAPCADEPKFSLTGNNFSPYIQITPTSECYYLDVYNFCNAKTPSVLSVISQSSTPPVGSGTMGPEMAPITTNSSQTLTQLIEDVFIGGGCFDVTNVQLIGGAAGVGSFANGTASIGFDSGVVLSTGNIATVTGPNNSGSAGGDNGGGSDVDLAQLTSQTINDAAGIEFDFSPTLSTIEFRFAFGSEEYCEWVNSAFNDVFGFFISGPGINGPYSGNGENIALVPMTTQAITINTINDVTNTNYFVPNSAGCGGTTNTADIQFDGYTTILTATANVIPCQTYRIRLVVGDGTDSAFDSAVFLEAGSFNAGGQASVEAINLSTGSNIIYEDCGDGLITFTRETGDLSMPITITFNVAPNSTATAGVDYAPLPNSVTIPAGQSFTTIPLVIFSDLVAEGQENIIVEIDNSCSCINNTAEILINDNIPIALSGLDDQVLCGPSTVTLSSTATGGVPPFTYAWSNGASGASISPFVSMTETFTVTVTDACGNTETDQVLIEVGSQEVATMSGGGDICPPGNPVAVIQIDFTGLPPWDIIYTQNGAPQPMITGITQNPYLLTVSELGSYGLLEVMQNGCLGIVNGGAVVTQTVITPVTVATDVSCWGNNDGSINVFPSGGIDPYFFVWDNPAAGIEQNPTNLPAGVYNVTVTDVNGCSGVASATINEPDPIIPTATGSSVDCNNAGSGTVTLTVTGGTNPLNFLWSNGAVSQSPTGLTAGTYTVTITDLSGCTATAEGTVTENFDYPDAVANAPFGIDCNNPQVNIDGFGSSVGPNFSYNWSGGPIVNGQGTLNPTVGAGGTYTLVVTNTTNGCTATATATVTEDINLPDAVANAPSLIDCNNPQVSINGFGSSVGPNFTYQWTTSNGSILSGATTLDPLVNSGGSYLLTVTNTNNGCTQIALVDVFENLIPPVANAGPPQQIGCNNNAVTLFGAGSSTGANFIYQWTTTDGVIISGENTLTPQVAAAGTYQIVVTDVSNGCTDVATVDVTNDTATPTADAGTAAALTCSTAQLNLDGSASSSGAGFTYIWTTLDGNIIANATTLAPTIDAAGTYELEVTGPNGCTSTAAVTVNENTSIPTAVAVAPTTLSCTINQVSLDGTGSSSGGNFNYLWTTLNGNIVAGETTLNPTVNQAGTYEILVTNTDNGCTQTATVEVTLNADIPSANVGSADQLTCTNSEIILNGSGSVGNNITYLWTTINGSIVSGEATLNPIVNAAGVYQLLVTDNNNGCTNIAVVAVQENITEPSASASALGALTCTTAQVSLDGSGSSTGGNFTYLWTTTGGNILSGETTLNPEVNAAGTYQILVTDTDNGCTQTASVEVVVNGDVPAANAGMADDLTCEVFQITLNGSGSTGTNFTYLWTTPDGNILSGENTLNPIINAAGTYELLVVNTDNGCDAISTVIVNENIEAPEVNIDSAPSLTCSVSAVTLNANNTSTSGIFSYLWTTPNGSILSGETTLTPTVGATGTYELITTNADNGCTQIATVEVTTDGDVPVANAGVADDLTCETSEIILNGDGSSGNNITYLWTTLTGNIIAGQTTLNPVVNGTGTYQLLVTNTDNGCTNVSTVEVNENLVQPLASAASPTPLTCTDNNVLLDGDGSSVGFNFTYLWTTTNGNIVAGETTLNPEVNAAGTYQIVVTDTDNGCTQTATVEVVVDGDVPTAEAGEADDLNCDVVEITLNGSGSTGANFTYLWTTQDGNILADATTLNPLINEPGTYELLVTDTDNGCTAISTVTVNENVGSPAVFIEIDSVANLTCATTEIVINVNNTSTGGNFSYAWSTQNGNIVSGENTLTPTVNQNGTYFLQTTNLVNGCSFIAPVEVLIDEQAPVVDAGAVMEINCNNQEVELDGSNSASGTNFTYAWTTLDGNILSGENTVHPMVGATGTYELVVTNTDNGCTAIDEVFVDENIEAPMVNAGNQQTLSCSQTSLQLNGNGSSIGTNFTYLWTTPNGNILSGENTLTPEINAPGDYVLEIINTNNGCLATSTVTVNQDSNVPVADAGIDDLLNCNTTSLILDGSNSSTGIAFTYAWTTSNGNIVFGENSLNPEINAAGMYQLVVTNNTNGCTSLSTVEITLDDAPPIAEAGTSQFLSCTNNSLTLDGNGSSTGADYTYQWITQSGNIIAGENTLTPEINATGIYELVVTSLTNGCTTTDIVEITQDSSLPTADAGAGFEITCDVFEGNLDGTASVINNDITFEWTTQGGNIVSGVNTLTPFVDAAGVYQLTLTNTVNGCTAVSSVTISNNNNEPTAEAGISQELNCYNEVVTLNGSTPSTSTSLTYLWTTQDGSILSGENTLNPEVDGEGIYELLITDVATGCTSLDQVTITEDQEEPIADAGPTFELNCTQAFATLDGSSSSVGANFIYQWTTQDGNIVSGENTLNPDVNMAGEYELTVTNLVNGCSEVQSVVITEDIDLPTADAGIAGELTCVLTTLTLNANNSSTGAEFEYQWTTLDGNIAMGENTLSPEIDDPGTYVLVVTNTSNSCSATAEITVEEDVEEPIADAGDEGLLTCTTTAIQLDGNNSSTGITFTYIWETNDGTILSGENTLSPTIGETGTYELIVTNVATGCTANAFVDVLSDGELPDAVATPDGVLNCNESVITINGNGSSVGANFTYQWTTQNGAIVDGETTTTPTVSATGAYTLIVTNNDNGCTSATTVTVEDDFEAPVASIDQTGATSLDCDVASILLDGSASQPLGSVAYNWTTTNGNILSGANTANPEVDDAGQYFLTVTNLLNGCTATTSINVSQDLSVPLVNIANPLVLTCDLTEIDLNANSSSTGANYSYQWTTPNGNIVTGANTLNPTINQSGSYQLTIIDLNNNCDNASSITVLENTVPPVAEAGVADILDCQVTEVTLNGSGSSSVNTIYEWISSNGNILTGADSTTPTVNAAGSYTLVVTDTQNGCTASDFVIVEQDASAPTDILFSLTLPKCHDDLGGINIQTVEGGTAPYLYSIDGVNFYSGSNFTVEPGNYTLYAQDASGCELQTDLEIPALELVTVLVQPEVDIELGEDYQIETFTNIPPNEIAGVEWLPAFRLSCTDCLNPVAQGLKEDMTYTVTVTNIYGCKTSASITINVERARNIFIPNVFSPNNDGENDVFMIFGGKLEQIKKVHTFQIYDRWGEQVYRQDDFIMPMNPLSGWDGTLRGKPLNPQVFVYYAEIEFIDGYTERFEGDVALRR
ncbi:MAG: choice-of-anchor L domain-containing protein [Bacteroidota bacterium]